MKTFFRKSAHQLNCPLIFRRCQREKQLTWGIFRSSIPSSKPPRIPSINVNTIFSTCPLLILSTSPLLVGTADFSWPVSIYKIRAEVVSSARGTEILERGGERGHGGEEEPDAVCACAGADASGMRGLVGHPGGRAGSLRWRLRHRWESSVESTSLPFSRLTLAGSPPWRQGEAIV